MRALFIGTAFLLVATLSVVALSGTMHFSGETGRPDINLSVTYPDKVGTNTLSSQQQQLIRDRLSAYLHQYDSVTLYINHYPARKMRKTTEQANFTLTINCKDGCVLQSKIMYTPQDRLAKEIVSKIDKAFAIDRYKYRKAVMITGF